MAKIQKSMTFSNAMIDMESMNIIEYDKSGDETGCFDIHDVLTQWDGVYGITLSLKQQDDFSAAGGE